MRHIRTTKHSSIDSIENKSIFKRIATRAIVLKGRMVLLLYTKRYHDYSLPGGGLDAGEELALGMIRELQEETGAKNIHNIKEFGLYEEYRPWYKPEFEIQHMLSYCFTCSVDEDFGESKLEDYELNNGMRALWIDIDEAILHNESTMHLGDKKAMSIERETYLLRLIKKELL